MKFANRPSCAGLTVVLGAIVLLVACGGGSEIPRELDLPATPILAIQTSWAVVTSTHLRLREQPDISSAIVTTLWRGYVLEVVSKHNRPVEIDGEKDYWYQVNFGGLQGWVFGAYLSFHTSKTAAEAAGESLRR